MVYAFSRDGAMPLSSLWHKVNNHEVPMNAVWLSAIISFCMALTYLGSEVAFQAMVSIATIGLYIAYALPIFFRVTLARKSFIPGPFNLGRYGVLVGWIAVLWVATISILFSLPVTYPHHQRDTQLHSRRCWRFVNHHHLFLDLLGSSLVQRSCNQCRKLNVRIE
ncbi:hypothetical protein OIU74_027961 [Salix koriyanagi]|uniref:Uncharacterized protein n=1 Tax=Salix koriyanagi TaxID=2511006 RepID=A0A9Q0SB19_9ROSI|nr:hypothetical protein OIU74_027961 [Salix koriyanagi]